MHKLVVGSKVGKVPPLEELLTSVGYEVVGWASSGEETINMAKRLRPDLILMDYDMPGKVGGGDTAGTINAELDIPVVFLSDYGDAAFVERAKNVEPSGYIVRPFQENEVKMAVEVALYKRDLERQLRKSNEQLMSEITTRKQAENELRKFNTIFDNAGYGITIVDLEGKVSYVNTPFARMHGYTSGELIGKHLSIFHTEQQMANVNRLIEQLNREGSYVAEEVGHKRNDNTEFPTLMNGTLVKDENGTPLFMAATAIDITEQKRAQEALRTSEEKFRTLAESAQCGITIFQGEKSIYNNPAVTSFTGYTKEELEHMNFWDMVRPDFKELVKERGLNRQKGKPVPTRYEFPILTKNNEERWIDISVGNFELNGKPTVISTAFDITERKQMEEALRESEEKYRSLVESTEDSIYLVDRDCRYHFVNAKALSRLGRLPLSNVIGRVYGEFHHEEDTKEFTEKVEEVFKTGKYVQYEHRSLSGGKYFLRTLNPVRELDGRTLAVTVTSKDITDLMQAKEQIKRSLREKEVLLKEIHHRVKNNLQIISSLLSLQSESLKDKQAVEIFENSQNCIRSMALIHERLCQSEDLTRIDFKEYTQRLVDDLAASYQVDSDAIALTLDLDALLDIETAIPCGLMINELVSNALEHAFPEGRSGKISIAFHADKKGTFTLSISDDGIGFPKDVDFPTSGSMGLQLVCMLVEQLEGTIELDRSGGTKFTITFGGWKRSNGNT